MGLLLFSGGLAVHCVYDICISNPREAVLHSGPDERRGSPLPPISARRLLRERGAILRSRSHSGPRAHAQQICGLQGPQGTVHKHRG